MLAVLLKLPLAMVLKWQGELECFSVVSTLLLLYQVACHFSEVMITFLSNKSQAQIILLKHSGHLQK